MAEYGWRLVVPTVDNSGNPIKTALLQHIADEMARAFGGVTVYPAAGCWDEGDKLHCDTNMVLTSAQIQGVEGPSQQQGDLIIAQLAHEVGEATGQAQVLEQSERFGFSNYQPGHYADRLPGDRLQSGMPVIPQTDVFAHVLGRPAS